jgi:hypothetical protein
MVLFTTKADGGDTMNDFANRNYRMTENAIADRGMDAAFMIHREEGPGLPESVS